MATMIDSLTNLITPAVGQIAGKLGESEASVSQGATAGFGSLLGGLLNKSRDAGAFSQIFDMISSPPPSSNLTNDLASAVGTMGTGGGGMANTASNFLGSLFGGNTNAVTDLLGRSAGFKNSASALALLKFAAPMLINFLGKKVRDGGMNAHGLTNLLTSERDSIVQAAPPGLMDVLQSAPETPHVEREVPRAATPADRPYVGDTHKERSGRWLWPAVGIAALLLAFIAVRQGREHRVTNTVSTGVSALDTMAMRPGAAIDTAGGEVSPSVSGLGALGKKRLPNGIIISIPAYGAESRVVAFIEGSQPIGTHNSFDLDRVSFAPGSSEIMSGSQDQLNNVAAILRAYPNATVKIAGYSDNAGSPVTNLKLSQERANAVKLALERAGISSSRMTSEAGGVRNQRVALIFTHK